MKKHSLTLSIAVLAFLSSLAQTTAKEWYDKGISFKQSEKFDDAISAFKKAVSLQATYADALHQLGWCYNEIGQYDDAVDVFERRRNNGSSDLASTNLEIGYAYKNLKKYDEAFYPFE